jgi:DNA (cytosine-5)-methyltransferase 1
VPAFHSPEHSRRGHLYNYVDLFAGCGGLSLGIERSGGKLQLAVEKSDMAAYTFYANFIDEKIDDNSWKKYVSSSIENQVSSHVAVSALRDVLDNESAMFKLAASGVDVVVGGPPCQGFSLAGRRNPDDVRNKLPWEYLEFVKRTAPKLVVIENVVGMSHKFAQDEEAPFVQLQQALRETEPGYVVQGVAVNALHYGAPQNRPRLMIIGLRSDVAKERGIESSGKLWRSGFLDEIDLDLIPPLAPTPTVRKSESPTIADAIGDLQTVLPESHSKRAAAVRAATKSRSAWGLPKSGVRREQLANQTPRNHSDSTTQRFRLYQWLRDNDLQPRLLSELASGTEASRARVELAISAAKFPAQSPDGTVLAKSSQELLALMQQLQTKKHSQKALAWDQPARTVVTLPDDYVHPSEPRIFTVREMARFQGFPDDFEFRGKETTGSLRRRFEVPQYSQVGNAVSPFLSLAVGKMITNVLGV